MSGLTEAQVRAIVREEIAAAAGRAPEPAALVPFARLESIHRGCVDDLLRAGRLGEAEGILRAQGGMCAPIDVDPKTRNAVRGHALGGRTLPASPHLPGWPAFVTALRPFADDAAIPAIETNARADVRGIVEKLNGSPPPHYARSPDYAGDPRRYHRELATSLARVLTTWRWVLAPSDFPVLARGVFDAINRGDLTTGDNLSASEWTKAAS